MHSKFVTISHLTCSSYHKLVDGLNYYCTSKFMNHYSIDFELGEMRVEEGERGWERGGMRHWECVQ